MSRRVLIVCAALMLLHGCANTVIYEGKQRPDTRVPSFEVEVWVMSLAPESEWSNMAKFEFRLVFRSAEGERSDACIDSAVILQSGSGTADPYYIWREVPCESRRKTARRFADDVVAMPLPLPDSILVRVFVETRQAWGAPPEKRVIDYVLPRRKRFMFGGA